MARIKHTARPATFQSLHTVALSVNEGHKDCAVKAVALACNVSYEVAHSHLKQCGRQDNKGTPTEIIWAACRALGYNVQRWSFAQNQTMIRSYPGVHSRLQSITTHHPRRFRAAWAQHDHKTLMFLTPRHIACFKGGVVHDWSVNNALRVDGVFEVTKM